MDINPTAAGMAWFCFSIPLFLTVFFRFNRVWSLRNLDLVLLLCVSVGVVLNRYAKANDTSTIALLVIATSLLLVRLLSDNYLEKRPRIESNLNPAALMFLGLSGVALLIVAIVVAPLPASSQETVNQGKEVLNGKDHAPKEGVPPPKEGVPPPKEGAHPPKEGAHPLEEGGPASTALSAQAVKLAQVTGEPEEAAADRIAAGILAGLGHLAVLGALIFIGIRHFQNWRLGMAMAATYLLLPSTILDPNSVNQVLSAAWILWALALHRVPWAAGVLMGLACGSLLYPALLLPVWLAFYGRKGALRFGVSLLGVWAVLLGGFAILSADRLAYVRDSLQIIAGGATSIVLGELPAITARLYRAPIIGLFVVMLIALTVWPRVKRFEHLLAAAAAIIVGVQFWYPQQFSEYLTGYIPLVVLIAYRPRLHQPAGMPQSGRRTDLAHRDELTQLEPVLSGTGASVLR